MVLDDENPLDTLLSSTMFTLHAAICTMTQHTLEQVLFGQDSILNKYHKAN